MSKYDQPGAFPADIQSPLEVPVSDQPSPPTTPEIKKWSKKRIFRLILLTFLGTIGAGINIGGAVAATKAIEVTNTLNIDWTRLDLGKFIDQLLHSDSRTALKNLIESYINTLNERNYDDYTLSFIQKLV